MIQHKISNIVKLSNHFTSKSAPQIFTQHGHPPEDFQEPITNQLVKKWGAEGSIHISTPDWEFIPEIKNLIRPDDKIIAKRTYDAFLDTGLEEGLRKLGVERVVICGVMTDCCCDTTGRSAFNRGFETWMVKDATGSASEAQHRAGLKTWGFGFGEILDTETVIHSRS